MDDNKLNNIPNINMLYEYAMDNSEYVMIKEMFLSALFFNTASAMALRNIRIKRKSNNKDKIIIPNYFAVTFAGSGCVDKDTEFLTPIGWKKISEYKQGDLVLQWNPDNSTQFVNPSNYISEPEVMLFFMILNHILILLKLLMSFHIVEHHQKLKHF